MIRGEFAGEVAAALGACACEAEAGAVTAGVGAVGAPVAVVTLAGGRGGERDTYTVDCTDAACLDPVLLYCEVMDS